MMQTALKRYARNFRLMEKKVFGYDGSGKVFQSIEEMWQNECESIGEEWWYNMGNQYWAERELTISGILGDLPECHIPDISDSRKFLHKLARDHNLQKNTVLDCGAGFGRVTKYLLVPEFSSIDIVDQCAKYMDAAPSYVDSPKLKNCFAEGLQTFAPEEGKYDCIWVQWVLSHLTDKDLKSFLERIKVGLKQGGLLAIKENTKKSGFMLHREDWSVTRPEHYLKSIIEESGFRVVEEAYQTNFPSDTFKVKMFGCVPS